jgi:hypothetical protein
MNLTSGSIAQVVKMRKLRWFSVLAALALAACGGSNSCHGSFANSCSSSTTPPVVIGSLTLLTSTPQIPSGSTTAATITALVKDASNNVMSGVKVVFQADSGSLVNPQNTTDTNGLAQVTLNAGSDPTNRAITVTASVGTTTATVSVDVSGTTLALSGSPSLVLNANGTYSTVLKNAAGTGIPGIAVTLTSAKGNVITTGAGGAVTDSDGRLTFTMSATNGGTDTVTAAALGQSSAVTVNVSTQSFNFTAPTDGTKVTLGVAQSVTVTWLNNNVPQVGLPVTFSATRGWTGAGPSVINYNASGVTAQLNLVFVADNPSQLSLQAGPATVAVQGTSTITAVVRDATNNLVEGATVNFALTTDPTNGGLSAASAVTNSQGSAQVVYTAGNSSSGGNGVGITASVQNLAQTTTYTANTTLTVGGQTVFLSMGTGNKIDITKGDAVYQIVYTVFAVDSNGAPLPNVQVTTSVLPVAYGKGQLACGGTSYAPVYSTLTTDPDAYNGQKLCTNEDTDYTGNINSLGLCPNGSGGTYPCKDYNRNNKLDPGNVAVVSPASAMTDANGRVDVAITYPRDHSYWTEVTLKASTTVQGTESSTSATFVLVGEIDDYKCSTGPPGFTSPYGVAATCANPN